MSNTKAMFDAETTEHELTILHDDGLYRHVKCAAPGTNIWRFDLVTWPGHLAVSGDLGSYTFSRLPDMFEFFEGDRGINPSYWAQKVVAGKERTTEYSPDLARQHVIERFWEDRLQRDEPNAPLWRAIRQEVISRLGDDEREAHDAICNFEYRAPRPSVGKSLDFRPERISRRHADYRFTDAWEWDLRDHDSQFILICHAIVWGIAKYRAAKLEVAA
ncbi:hypothetical protein [Rhodococcus globerulus]|uniref:Uncharacterized protein n=1 Tax=Rhodococcus globerulus TaxID=33008 RepID=A0ABU4BS75_RHOGO|nr:hypothetical protein [Rhodococcus globerulus]MDV6267045.1 hypothetical protein [Rhodococcus globerulus]